jgi:hypothetical protein
MKADFAYLSCALCQEEIDQSKYYACIRIDEKYLHMECSQKVREASKRGERLTVTTSKITRQCKTV